MEEGEAVYLIPQFMTIKMLGLTSRARLQHILEDGVTCGGLVLDAGCGSGELLVSLLLRGFDVIGVDRDIRQLGNLGAALKQVGGRCHLVAADVSELPFRESSFGVLCCMEVINMLQNDEEALSELVRVLERHGTCNLSVPHEKYPVIYDPLNRLLERMGMGHRQLGIWSPGVRRLYTPSELLHRLRRLGLNPIRLDYIGKWLVPALENYLSSLLYYKVLAPKFRTKAAFKTHQTGSAMLSRLSKVLDLAIRLDKMLNLPGTHFIIKARKA